MELGDAVRRRRMVRSFADRPIDAPVLRGVLDLARRAPSAGFTQGCDFVVLEGAAQTARYWDLTLPAGAARDGFRWPGLRRAPVLVVVVTDPAAYAARYAEPDKVGAMPAATWPVPFWWVDAGAVVENLLLAAVDAGLGACLFGLFDHERAVLDAFGVPADRRGVATIALGHPDDEDAPTGSPTRRPRRPLDEVVHRGVW